MADWGVHWMDQLLWWTEEEHPKYIYSTGGRPVRGEAVFNEKEQTTDAPDTQVCTWQFENFTATWEHRKYARNNSEKHSIGCYFYGTKGIFHMGWRDGWTFHPTNSKEPVVHQDSQLQEPDGHNMQILWADFLKAIESGKQPTCDIETSHRSSILPLLGMISYKTGQGIAWDGEKEKILNNKAANKLLKREYRGEWKFPEA
jgi:predicted dehydrogenase